MLINDPIVVKLAAQYNEQQLMSALTLLRENRLRQAEETRIANQKEDHRRLLKD